MTEHEPRTRPSQKTLEPRAPESTPEKILAAAGELLAANGLEGVSLREITRAAGQRNTRALQYHFGDRDGLIRALIAQRTPHIAARRSALLDYFATRGDVTLREAASILVAPLVTELEKPEGTNFLQIASHLINSSDELLSPDEARGALVADSEDSIKRWAARVTPLMPRGVVGRPLHRRFAVLRFTHSELGRRARVAPGQSTELFGSQLTDLVATLLGAPLSPETTALLDQYNDSGQ